MKIYRLELHDAIEGHQGYEFYGEKKEAEERATEYQETYGEEAETDIRVIEMKETKKDILRILNLYASHPDMEEL
jgi:hypothetical protein